MAAVEASGKDFFVSYASVNRAWAEWIAAQVEQAGYSTVLQAWDFRPGVDFAHEMQRAMVSARRTIAVLSPAYLVSEFGEAEWRAAFVRDPTGERGLLLPVRVQLCKPLGLLASRVYVDLVDVDAVGARKRLLAAVDRNRVRPTSAVFPGGLGSAGGQAETVGAWPRFPGAGPAVCNLPARNRNFTGRDEVVRRVYDDLRAGAATAVVSTGAVHGLGGVGKSAVGVEFGYRFASDYDVIWWIAAEQPAAVVAQLAALGRELGLAEPLDVRDAVGVVFAELRRRDRWLLVYDNAEHPRQLDGLLPAGGGGHVLLTSRWPAWAGVASSVPLGVWSRVESVRFLRTRTRQTGEALLDELAELVGDLPLALEEAGAYLEETGEDLAVYLELLRGRERELFGLTDPRHDAVADRNRQRVATVWTLSLDRVHVEAPVAEELLNLLAFLAPQVPRDLPTTQPGQLPPALGEAVADRLVYNRALSAVGRYALASLTPDEVGMHRLVQVVVRARLDHTEMAFWATTAVKLIRTVFPDDSGEVSTWPECQRLLPHLLAVTHHAQRLNICGEQTGWLLDRASTYLRQRGQYRQAEPLARRAVTVTETALGPDHPDLGTRRSNLGLVLRDLGQLDAARAQFEQALHISKTALGPDHPTIGRLRSNLGSVLHDLGQLDAARDQFEQALHISETTLGPDHPDIGIVYGNLSSVLHDLGQLDAARDQFEHALRISETPLGPDHPTIGRWRNNLGNMLRDLGRLDAARAQFERALRTSETALGPDHPDTGTWRRGLGSVLQALGQLDAARNQFEHALRISETALGPDHPRTRALRDNLAHLDRTE
ncbi:FxSxx-COOH system tetratricopeptide repeat protein [Plantactinospora mayteni]|uniref:ATP-binding protein n=1 Tax=Plantactinospora mayteni TaxID=566021 RepID=A0ABQ4F3X7_9ACTN|nr:FxSxx-COOH system tetratricopeptide repeat protein [Plantactinospora mayteni]GIH01602.1 ATP-binding protein [Plantactinospora mayteni]